MKAKAGVTLVELLVVMLIAVILAVSLLPMFKEYICKAQYSADAVPVIATLRTKISLYQYDHGVLPANVDNTKGAVSSWKFGGDGEANTELFKPAKYTLGTAPSPTVDAGTGKLTKTGKVDPTTLTTHIGSTKVLDIDYQDMKGKRSLPIDFVYYNIPCADSTDSAYVIGCFGAGNGLAAGTGYAVCELNLVSEGKKYLGTFERYKAKKKTGSCPYLYLGKTDVGAGNDPSGDYVYCPEELKKADLTEGTDKRPLILQTMENNGWKFSD